MGASWGTALLLLLVISLPALGQGAATASGRVVDRMVATVNGELITYSDLLWQLALQPGNPLDNPSSEALTRALNLLIGQTLIAQEAEKIPTISPSDDEVNRALADLIRQFPSRAEFEERMQRVGLTAEELRDIIRRRVEIEKYLDFRFRSFVVVTDRETSDYYSHVYVPRFRQRAPGRILPTLAEARAEIERTLTEGKIETAMNEFLDTARDRADIVILNQP
ncbi:MAG TPA: SurA N-terminal domain-containing protein [Pyrinomonadaceae bacterium]|nr:SurA N-terminal domain-containing protein [Pyrinomonadaceae bacterium]